MSEPNREVAVSNLGEAEHELQIEGSNAEWRIESPAEIGGSEVNGNQRVYM